jgi:RNA polymerase-binding transcription factor DksA
VAKKTVKMPSASGKPLRSAGPARNGQKKSISTLSKVIAKPAKKLAKPVEKPASRIPTRMAVSKAIPTKTAPTKTAPTKASAGKVSTGPQLSAKGMEKGKAQRPAKAAPAAAANAAPASAVPPNSAAAASSTNGKPRKNHAGFSSRELEHFRDLLLTKRRELIGDMSSMEREALRVGGGSNLSNLPIHMADMGTDNYEQEFTLNLVQKERDLLKEINLALAKIQNGTYGVCEGTQLPILKERLEYQPWARFSVEHQRKMERHGR